MRRYHQSREASFIWSVFRSNVPIRRGRTFCNGRRLRMWQWWWWRWRRWRRRRWWWRRPRPSMRRHCHWTENVDEKSLRYEVNGRIDCRWSCVWCLHIERRWLLSFRKNALWSWLHVNMWRRCYSCFLRSNRYLPHSSVLSWFRRCFWVRIRIMWRWRRWRWRQWWRRLWPRMRRTRHWVEIRYEGCLRNEVNGRINYRWSCVWGLHAERS